jgi:hypothetical protein
MPSNVQLFLGDLPIQSGYLGDKYTEAYLNPSSAPAYVTDGLIIYMDSTEPASYPGSGTTWYNLVSGQPYVGTIGASVTYTGQYLQTYSSPTTAASGIIITTSSFYTGPHTIMSATRYTDTSGNGRMLAGNSNNWLLGQWQNTTENYYAEGWVYGAGSGANDTNWRIYTATGDQASDSYSFFLNGTLLQSGSTAGSGGPNGLFAGSWGGSSEHSDGQVCFVMVYNRILSTAEVTQNYNALKSKVGL